jgi:tripartite-type tricarboxylate transporter receptor subunit TctC
MKRKRGLSVFILLLFSVLGAQFVPGAEYPNRPVTLVIPFGPGGGHDLSSRVITPVAAKYLGRPIIIELKPGGGGIIGSQQVVKAAPDGYTLLLAGDGPNCSLPAIEGRGFGPESFEAVCRVVAYPAILVARPDAPFKDLREMVEYARANPGKLVFSNTGPWGVADKTIKRVMKATGITMKSVPYDGGGPALTAVLGGHADLTSVTPYTGLAYIKAGKFVALAVLDYNRHPEYPNLPTAKEQGVDVVHFPWIGVAAPKGTPQPIIHKLSEAFKNMIEDNSTKEMAKTSGVETRYLGTEEFAKAWREEFAEYKELGKSYKK